jgi:hypothetical protein
MVQNRVMAIMVKMSDDRTYSVDVEGGLDEVDVEGGLDEAEAEIERIKNREGSYSSGWFTVRGGKHLRVEDIREMHAFERRI